MLPSTTATPSSGSTIMIGGVQKWVDFLRMNAILGFLPQTHGACLENEETVDRYYLAVDIDYPVWQEVTKEQFVKAEYAAGFRGGRPGEPATAGFTGGGVRGKVAYVREEMAELSQLQNDLGLVE